LWFALANFCDNLEWLIKQKVPATVKPFGVYVSGHTHSASLDRITFSFSPKAREIKPYDRDAHPPGLEDHGPKI